LWLLTWDTGLTTQTDEINPYTDPKPKELLDISPKGLVPALAINVDGKMRALNESTVILQYLEE
jgi:glutathione S-transferase